jgi:hypothetical protein
MFGSHGRLFLLKMGICVDRIVKDIVSIRVGPASAVGVV